jgi:hypothetical protein
MGVPTSEVGYTSATTRKETTKSIRDMWWYWETKITTFKLILYGYELPVTDVSRRNKEIYRASGRSGVERWLGRRRNGAML